MEDKKKIDLSILGTTITIETEDAEQQIELARELDEYLTSLVKKHPISKQNEILAFCCLAYFSENKKLQKEINDLIQENARLDSSIKSVLNNIS